MEDRYNPLPVLYSERPNMYSERPNMYSERPNLDGEQPTQVPRRVINAARGSGSPSLIAPRQSSSPVSPPPVVQSPYSPVPASANEGSRIRIHDAYARPARVITLRRNPVHPTPILIRI